MKNSKALSIIAMIPMVLGLAQITAPAAQAAPSVVRIHANCSYYWNTQMESSPVEVINVAPGDTVHIESVYNQLAEHKCDTTSYSPTSDLVGLFSVSPAPGTTAVTDPIEITISSTATEGSYGGELQVYHAGSTNWGNRYKFLVTSSRITPSNSYNCDVDGQPLNIYVTAQPNTWYGYTVTGYCDYSGAYGNIIRGAEVYDINGISTGRPYFYNGNDGPGTVFSYYRTHEGQHFYIEQSPEATTAAASNIDLTSFRVNGTATHHGISNHSNVATRSSIYFCISTSAAVDGNGKLTCNVTRASATPAQTPETGTSPGQTVTNTTNASADITGLTTGTTYYYQTQVVNPAGVAAYGSVFSAVPFSRVITQSIDWGPTDQLEFPQYNYYAPDSNASASGGTDITYAVVAGSTSDCELADPSSPGFYVTTIGTCKIAASTLGNEDYSSATKVVTFNISKARPDLRWDLPTYAIRLVDDPTNEYYLGASATTSGNTSVEYIRDSGTSDCAVVNSYVPAITVTTLGTCSITIHTPESDTYLAGNYTVEFNILGFDQVLSWTGQYTMELPEDGIYVGGPVSALNDAVIEVYTGHYGGDSDCEVTDTSTMTLMINRPGTCWIAAYVYSAGMYAEGEYYFEITFTKHIGTVNWDPTTTTVAPTMGDSYTPVSAETNYGQSIYYSVIEGNDYCSINDPYYGSITVTGFGSCLVRAESEETDWATSTFKEVTFTFTKYAQVINFSPNLTVAIPSSGLVTPSSMAEVYDAATVRFSVIAGANTSSNCVITNPTSYLITVSTAGTCTVQLDAEETGAYQAAQLQVTFTFTVDPNADTAPVEGDGNLAPKNIAGTGKFIATNDATFQLAWDKKNGKLISQATGIYTGYIEAKITFTKAGKTYSCTAQFGVIKAMPGKTAKDKANAKKMKTFVGKQFCTDKTKLDPKTTAPKGGLTPTNFKKIKPMNKTAAELKQEKTALATLKGFVGQVQIQVIRYRAWPTTMVNLGNYDSKGGKIPTQIRNTKVNLG